jgi:ERF superfamily
METFKNITKALIQAKNGFSAIHKNRLNPHFKSKYASLDSILEAITQPLCDAGILLVQPTMIRDKTTILITRLIHAESGESIESELIIPAQSDPQKLGAAMTYYRRFSLCAILAIAADDDDDGTAATANSTPKTAAKKVDPAIEAATQATRECFEILGWKKDRVMEWSKKINPAPFDNWTLGNWQTANTKALMEIDTMNSSEAIHY